MRLPQAVVVALWPCLLGWCWALGLAGLAAVLPWLATHAVHARCLLLQYSYCRLSTMPRIVVVQYYSSRMIR